MTRERKGASAANPLELREGAADRFYVIWGGSPGFLADGDLVTVSSWAAPAAVALASDEINGTNLTLDGVTYGPGEVASVMLSGIEAGDLVELENTVTTQAGRTDVQSLWVKGVAHYSA